MDENGCHCKKEIPTSENNKCLQSVKQRAKFIERHSKYKDMYLKKT